MSKKFILVSLSILLTFLFQNCGQLSGQDQVVQASNGDVSRSSSNGNPIALINNSSYKGNIYFDGQVLTGVLCTDSSVFIRVRKGRQTHVVRPAYAYTGSRPDRYFRYMHKHCDQKFKRIYFFSARIPGALRSGAEFRLNDRHKFTPVSLDSKSQQFGIQYTTYHCPMSQDYGSERVFDIKDIRQNGNKLKDYGPVNWHHWLERPPNGYYCLTDNAGLIKKHAVLLKNAGIDYIYLDMTNDPWAYDGDGPNDFDSNFEHKIHKPVMSLINTYKNLERNGVAVPKIVPWVGASTYYKTKRVPYSRSISRWINEKFYPSTAGLRFTGHYSKPIMFAKVGNPKHFSWEKVRPMIRKNESRYKVIIKWSQVEFFKSKKPENWTGINPNHVWRFMEPCKYNSNGSIKKGCQQRSISSQISVAAAFQRPYMSHSNSLGKRRGRTLYQQYLGAFNRSKKYVSFSNWNNWLTNRYCHGKNTYGGAGHFLPSYLNFSEFDYECSPGADFTTRSNGSKHARFVDSYTYEFSRVLEPSADSKHSDCHYQLMRGLVMASKTGQSDLTGAQKQEFINACGFDLRK